VLLTCRRITLFLQKYTELNVPAYIAKRLSGRKEKQVTRPVIRVSIFSIALSIAIILISFAIVRGFQKEVREKIIGFGSHIQIRPFDTNMSLEQSPMNTGRDDIESVKSIEGVESVFPFIEKGALIKTDSNIHGIVMKGVDADFDWTFFGNNLDAGKLPDFSGDISNEILVSKMMANLLHLDIDSPVRVYYIMQGEAQPRGRKYTVCGIYNTGMVEFDNVYALSDMRHLQQINRWGDSLVSGYEVMLEDFDMLEEVYPKVFNSIYYDLDAQDIVTRQLQFFDWLMLLDTNVLIILVLMTLVAIINVISIILMLILERIPMIGVLKSMGADNGFVRKIFVWHSLQLLLKGIVFGNIAGIGLILLQQFLHIIPLDQEMYYVSYVPVLLKPMYIITVNLGVFAIAFLAMFLPALIVRRIHPAKALRHQ